MNTKSNAKQAWKETVSMLRIGSNDKGTPSDDEVEIVEERAQPTSMAMTGKYEPKVYAVSIIAYGMTVNGDVSVLGDLELLGSMKGNIDSEGNVMISGRIVGDIHCKKNVVLKAAAVRGNIYASGTVTIDKDTAVVGDITGRSASIDGRVKGNLIFDETVFIQKDAVIIGDVTANKVAMNEGTQIVGYIKINVEAITSVEFEEVLF